MTAKSSFLAKRRSSFELIFVIILIGLTGNNNAGATVDQDMCDITEQLTNDGNPISISTSLITCIECVVNESVLVTNVQWTIELANRTTETLISGQNGIVLENGTMVISNASLFFKTLRELPFRLTCSLSEDSVFGFVYRTGFFPPTVSVLEGNSSVTEGDSITLVCEHSNFPGSTVQEWLSPQGAIVDSLLELALSNVLRNQSGEYQCRLTNVADNFTLSAPLTITVTYPTSVKTDSPITQTILVGSSLTLGCTYNSVPPSTVTWFHNTNEFDSGTDRVSINTNASTSTLTVANVMSEDSGEFECRAVNTLASGETTMDSMKFNVTIERIRCQPLSLENGQVMYRNVQMTEPNITGYELGTFSLLQCNMGYILVGDSMRICNQVNTTGSWSGVPSYCQAITCPRLIDPLNGNISYSNSTAQENQLPFGTLATYSCDEGHYLVGNVTRACQDDDQADAIGAWSGADPMCLAITCPSLDMPANGNVSFDDTRRRAGTLAIYSCRPGYALVGSARRMCLDDNNGDSMGTWSGNETSCEVIQCSPLDAIDNGEISYATDTRGNFTVGTEANISCLTGYLLVGTPNRTCVTVTQFNTIGEWSGENPFCENINECNGVNDCQQLCVNTEGSYTCSCSEGFTINNDKRTCNDINECRDATPPCEQSCNNTEGSFQCGCRDGYQLQMDNRTCASTGTESPISQVTKAISAVVVTLQGYTIDNFTEEAQQMFKQITASVINRYCSQNIQRCQLKNVVVVRTRRQKALNVTVDDIILADISENAEQVLTFLVIIQVGSQVLLSSDLHQAIQEGSQAYNDANFLDLSSQPFVVETPTTSSAPIPITPQVNINLAIGLSVAAAISLLLLFLMFVPLIYYCYKVQRSRPKKNVETTVIEYENPAAVLFDNNQNIEVQLEANVQQDGDRD